MCSVHATVKKNVFKSRRRLRKRNKISPLFVISRMRKHIFNFHAYFGLYKQLTENNKLTKLLLTGPEPRPELLVKFQISTAENPMGISLKVQTWAEKFQNGLIVSSVPLEPARNGTSSKIGQSSYLVSNIE